TPGGPLEYRSPVKSDFRLFRLLQSNYLAVGISGELVDFAGVIGYFGQVVAVLVAFGIDLLDAIDRHRLTVGTDVLLVDRRIVLHVRIYHIAVVIQGFRRREVGVAPVPRQPAGIFELAGVTVRRRAIGVGFGLAVAVVDAALFAMGLAGIPFTDTLRANRIVLPVSR